MERVNQLTTNVTPHNIIQISQFRKGAVHGDFAPISKNEARNTESPLKRSSVPSGIGCLSPVKAKNPHDIAKILGTGIDKGSRKLGWLSSNNIKIPIDTANTPQTQMPYITRSFNSIGNTTANLDECHVNNNRGSFLTNSPRTENQMMPMNLRSSMTWNMNNSKYTDCLDNENLSHTHMDSALKRLSKMPNVLVRENPDHNIHSPKRR